MDLYYIYKICGKLWKSREKIENPSECPKCRSKDIKFKNLGNIYKNPYL